MSSTPPTRHSPTNSRRINGVASPPPEKPSISRGATARSAASPRVSSSLNTSVARRGSVKAAQPPPLLNGETRESLTESLKQETEAKEHLLVQIQDKDQTITALRAEVSTVTSSLNAAEGRINELYSDQGRAEMELGQRIEVAEKLRTQVRDLEKEKRDLHRRYNEQTATFEAERQAFYDNEQHLKSRIQSLSQARRKPEPLAPSTAEESESEAEYEEEDTEPARASTPTQDLNDPDQEPAEMTGLRLELSTLSTSYSSLQSTLVLLQTQLIDLKRVNNELQEENESYMILLRERTLSGHYDLRKQVGGDSSDEESEEMDDADMDMDDASLRSNARSALERVEEEEHHDQPESLEAELERSLQPDDDEDTSSSRKERSRQQGRKRGASTSTSPSGARGGESLAGLPITGPGLDLAAELGRAENKDILEGNPVEEQDRSVVNGRSKRARKDTIGRKLPASESTDTNASGHPDMDALRTEVKALKDANKALSLYASKIIDRIISQEGFEHVLAADYEKTPQTPTVAQAKPPKARPVSISAFSGFGLSTPATKTEFPKTETASTTPVISPPNPRAQRRSMSFDFRGFFGGTEKKPDPNLRPLSLKPGQTSVTGGRKLETEEDEEDRKERERMNATMKLMGIQPAAPPSPAVMQKTVSSPGPLPTSPAVSSKRFSFFGRSNSTGGEGSPASSIHSTPAMSSPAPKEFGGNLTEEALEQAEAQHSLAALDARERSLSAEIAKGSSSGFTEIQPRTGRRSRRSAGGSGHSGSTVFSAGIDEDD